MMEKKKILLGFTDETFEKSIKELLNSAGYEAEILARVTKESVRDAVRKTPDLDSVVVMESFPKLSRSQKVQKYTAEELASLTDDSPANVIVVLSENHKGTDYARVLFASGITCAIFARAGKGVTSKEVATLIVRRRTRKAAREYYGIGQGNIDLGFLEADDFNELYERYSSRNGTPIVKKQEAPMKDGVGEPVAAAPEKMGEKPVDEDTGEKGGGSVSQNENAINVCPEGDAPDNRLQEVTTLAGKRAQDGEDAAADRSRASGPAEDSEFSSLSLDDMLTLLGGAASKDDAKTTAAGTPLEDPAGPKTSAEGKLSEDGPPDGGDPSSGGETLALQERAFSPGKAGTDIIKAGEKQTSVPERTVESKQAVFQEEKAAALEHPLGDERSGHPAAVEEEEDEAPLFDDFDDVELKDPRGGISGIFALAILLFLVLVGGLLYFGEAGWQF